MSLTPSQEAAVRAEARDLCVSAGAGSGKTRVLTRRFLDLVLRRGVRLERILALTFTEKAAGEMKARVAAAFVNEGRPDLRREAERGFVSTIHSHCARLLRERALEAGVDPGFRVLDEIEAEDLLRRSVLDALEELRQQQVEAAATMIRLASQDLPGDVADFYERVRATDFELGDLKPAPAPGEAGPADAEAAALFPHVLALLVRVDAVYGRRKAALGALDFADLERRALALLRRRAAERTFDHVLVDELQDVNRVQRALLEALRGRASLFAVGDVKQSIYRFRNAESKVMTELWAAAPAGGRHTLRETFRARPELVRFFDAFFPRLFSGARAGDVAFESVAARTAYDPLPAGTPAVELLRLPAARAERVRREEAAQLARRIGALVEGRERRRGHPDSGRRGEPLGWGDVAVLFRSLRDLKVYERAFTLQGIPYHVVRGRGFHATDEVADALNVLRLLEEPEDARALAAFLTSPMVGVTDAELLRFFRRAREQAPSPREYLERAPGDRVLPAALRRRLRRVRRLLAGLEERRRAGEIHHLVRAIVEETRSDLTALMQDGGPRRLFNLEKLVGLAREWDREGHASAADFLRAMTSLRERDVPEMEAVTAGEEGNVVRLMTVHAAKGLEFPVVVVPDLGRAPNRSLPRFLYDREGGVAFKVPDEEGEDAQETAGWRAVRAAEQRAEDEESARILYVAMTRAEELLILSGGRTKRSAGGSWIAWLEEFLEAEPEAVAETVRVIDVAGEPRPQGLRKALKRRHGGELLRGAPLPEPVPAGVRREAAALWTRTPPRAEPRDRTPYVAAVSDVVRFAACPLACRFRTVLGAEAWGPAGGDEPGASEPEGADDFLAAADARAWGNALHRLLETCDLDRGVTEAAAATAIGRELGREARAGEAAAAVAEVTRFLRSEAGVRARAAGGARVRRERPFLLRLEGVLLRGKIDLLVEPAGSGSWLVDYKSGAYAAERGARYRLQMLLYAEAVERITGARPERALLHFLADGRALEVPLTAAGRAEAAAVVRAFAAAHEADAFPAAPGPERCIPCEFQAACRFAIVRG